MPKSTKRKTAGRRREGKALRVVLGASVKPDTRRQMMRWTAHARRSDKKANVGRVLDKLVADSKRAYFCPIEF